MNRSFLPEAIIASIPIALLYFLGWAYLAHLMGRFGIDVTVADIPFQTVLIFSFRPLSEPEFRIGLALAVASFLIIKLFAHDSVVSIIKMNLSITMSLVIVATPLIFLSLAYLAKESADTFAWKVWNDNRVRVQPAVKKSYDWFILDDYKHCISKNWLRHIVSFQKQSFFLCTDVDGLAANGRVYQTDSDGSVQFSWRVARPEELKP